MTLGARVLGEFGDDPNRYADAKSRKNYAGTSPITRASGKHRVVLARYARNRRLADACYHVGLRHPHRQPRRTSVLRPTTAPPATPTTGPCEHSRNRLVGILHGCLRHHTPYDEHTAWGHRTRLPLDSYSPWDV